MNQDFEKLLAHISEFEKARAQESENSNSETWNENYYAGFLLADTRFRYAAKRFDLEYPDAPPIGDVQDQMRDISARYKEYATPWKTLILSRRIEAQVALEYDDPTQEFAEAIAFDGEHRNKIHEIIGALRTEVHDSNWMNKDQKRRVLSAINSVQSEVDKEISNFHLMLGKIVDLGDAFGTAGKKAKPAFDRIDQLANAVRGQRKQSLSIEKQEEPLKIEDKSDEME
ncbi:MULTISPECIES: hypothetical protein [unclassified Ruegeria]|uniref:hypothetical protein n=1 Tax=unclassified Ruegeria TaxID=2625375 RepID=UPI0014886E6D|nr:MULTISPECIES: hypothetical protein [unclassified Ruegeria]NOD78003.1 hypothetical protein [Ruegeria sp. HKCCD4332]